MNAPTEVVQFLRDAGGQPAFAVLPFAHYQALVTSVAHSKPKTVPGIPAAVVERAIRGEITATRAWREHAQLTQEVLAARMGITQGAYAQLEAKKTIRKSSRVKIAQALGINEAQLDF